MKLHAPSLSRHFVVMAIGAETEKLLPSWPDALGKPM